MEIQSSHKGKVAVLSPIGRVDHETVDELNTALEPWLSRCTQAGEAVVLDLAGIEHVSAFGLGVLMQLMRRIEQQQGLLAIAAVRPNVLAIFEISHFNRMFKLFKTVDEAAKALV